MREEAQEMHPEKVEKWACPQLLAPLGRQHRELRVPDAHQPPSLRGTNVSCESFELQIIP